MKATLAPNGNLLISLDDGELDELKQLREDMGENFGSDLVMRDWFERFIANSEYNWVLPENVNALTDAPILGILAEQPRQLGPTEEIGRGNVHVGGDERGPLVIDVVQCWGFMDYAIISLQERLLTEGIAEFTRGF